MYTKLPKCNCQVLLLQMATYNWIITCGCENPAIYTCNTCGLKLCASCKKIHLENNDTRHHSIVDYANILTPGCLSSLFCHAHDEKECICWCQTCKKASCIDCVTTTHHGHAFTKLENILQDKRTTMQNELENLDLNVKREWQDLLTEARKATSDFLSQANGIEKQV